jgi:hypothetical protein
MISRLILASVFTVLLGFSGWLAASLCCGVKSATYPGTEPAAKTSSPVTSIRSPC